MTNSLPPAMISPNQPTPTSATVRAALDAYDRELREIECETLRLSELRRQIETATVFDVVCMERFDHHEQVRETRKYGRRLIRLAADNGPSEWRGDFHSGLDRASEIAAVPLHSLLMAWVTEQERALAARRAVWAARDLPAELVAAMTPKEPTP